jgi:hypothetical protein
MAPCGRGAAVVGVKVGWGIGEAVGKTGVEVGAGIGEGGALLDGGNWQAARRKTNNPEIRNRYFIISQPSRIKPAMPVR